MVQVSHYIDRRGSLRIACHLSEGSSVVFRSVGGGYDGANREWVFPAPAIGRAKAAMIDLFGESDDVVRVEVRSRFASSGEGRYRGWDDGKEVVLGGYVLAARRERDFQAEVVEELCAGLIPAKGGSVNRPRVAPSVDAVFSLEVRRDFAEANGIPFVEQMAPRERVSASVPQEVSAYPSGNYTLALALPAGDPAQTADMVRTLVSALSDEEILGALHRK